MGLHIYLLSLIFYLMLVFVQCQDWTIHIVLDGDDIFHLYWNPPEDIRGDSEISFRVELKSKGYFGLGFSPNGGMPGSDIITGWIKDGEVYFQDRYADAFSLPPIDQQQDYNLIDAYENETFTVFEFRRKLDTCDENDWVINESTMRVIYAYSEEDPANNDPFYHRENRGSKSVILLQYGIEEIPDLNVTSLLQWDVLSPGIDISVIDTLYWCTIVKSPDVAEKHHIVSFKALLQEGNEQFIHHMVLYECAGGTSEQYEKFLEDGGRDCASDSVPVEMLRCQELNFNWAVGGHDLVLPENVGFPMDPGPGKYYMFEMHYNNPQHMNGEIDYSGLRFYYTHDVRTYDAGIFTAGASILPRVFIPPGQNGYTVTGHAHPECFTSLLQDGRAKALAIHLHAHLIAEKMKVRHFRGNEELVPLYNDEHYDFHYQVYRFYPEEVDIFQNDQITIECTYNSSERSNATFGGLSTREEMCLTHILYYPRVNKTVAESKPSYITINRILNTNVTNEEDVLSVLGNYDWESIDIDEVQNAMMYSEHETQCYVRPFGREEEHGVLSYPNDLIPYEPQSSCDSAA